MRKTVLTLIAAGIVSLTSADAQQEKLAKLDSEMKVIEEVVQVILSDSEYNGYYSPGRVTGAFIEGYGAVVMTAISTRNFRGEKAVRAEESYEDIRERFNRLFPDYISRIKELNPNDNISIIVAPTDKSLKKWTGKKSKSSQYANREFRPYPYILSAKRSEILRGDPERVVKITRIDKGTGYYTSATREDIRIMKAIFSRSIEDEFRTNLSSSAIQAAYLNGYGLLFTIEASGDYFSSGPKVTLVTDATLISEVKPGSRQSLQIEIDRPERFFSKAERLQAMENRLNSLEVRTEKLVDRLTELLGMYSGTIEGLDSDDLITVYFSASDNRRDALEGLNLRISLKAGDVENYRRGRTDLESLKKKLMISQIK